ncbi:S-methyl-5'-thioadenosine phosphorylase [Streptomyces sioyaensis]|uniref:Purine nucleoside phosphorylase n=1 Tax=Streptomyces sioyaensis TaxID=67364 RepID=A0A4Q1R1W6_9ACTN|nr:S-methyl-5'-thioadenosine phosphorylase [Streptomyces sioyaensis]MBM4792842.1 S-methyl-5'-thioadenosine phosphorylase [Streptomyces sioyaensis]RXS65129.1 S-methyl-5'-thioadenosine phosphorylase [Streptomyces sioyaensis]
MTDPQAEIGIIGGSGLYSLLEDSHEVYPDTPYGKAVAPLTIGELAGRRVAFLPRHGRHHQYAPHLINYRANMWSLQKAGVTQVIGVGAVGSLTPSVPPGSLVVPDQIVDRTTSRAQTYFDCPNVAHTPFADPYCPAGRRTALQAADKTGWPPVDGGTQVVIEGPRFSTRAESQWYAAQGWTIIGMTAHPEAVLARELGLCYTPLSLVTDLDAGIETGEGVTQEEVMQAFAGNLGRLRDVLDELVALMPGERDCGCALLKPGVL